MTRLGDIDLKILFELMQNCRISDRALGERLGVSQPTVTRRRAELERRGLLRYSAIPMFEELGLEIFAFSFLRYNQEVRKLGSVELTEKIEKTLQEHPNIVFASSGRGLGFDGVAVSVHKDYADYVEFVKSHEEAWGEWVRAIESFTVSLKSDNVIRPITFQHVLKHLNKRVVQP